MIEIDCQLSNAGDNRVWVVFLLNRNYCIFSWNYFEQTVAIDNTVVITTKDNSTWGNMFVFECIKCVILLTQTLLKGHGLALMRVKPNQVYTNENHS